MSCTPIDDNTLRYNFSEPAGWSLVVLFDASSGRVADGRLELPASTAAAYASIGISAPGIADLAIRAAQVLVVDL